LALRRCCGKAHQPSTPRNQSHRIPNRIASHHPRNNRIPSSTTCRIRRRQSSTDPRQQFRAAAGPTPTPFESCPCRVGVAGRRPTPCSSTSAAKALLSAAAALPLPCLKSPPRPAASRPRAAPQSSEMVVCHSPLAAHGQFPAAPVHFTPAWMASLFPAPASAPVAPDTTLQLCVAR